MNKGSSAREFGLMGKIDGFVREENLREDAIKIVQQIRPEWKDEDIQTKVNMIFRYSHLLYSR